MFAMPVWASARAASAFGRVRRSTAAVPSTVSADAEEHDPEKCEAVFRKNHAQEESTMRLARATPALDLRSGPAPHRFPRTPHLHGMSPHAGMRHVAATSAAAAGSAVRKTARTGEIF